MSTEDMSWIGTEEVPEVPWMHEAHEAPCDASEADWVFEQAETDLLWEILDPSQPCINQCNQCDETNEYAPEHTEWHNSVVDMQTLLSHDINDEDMNLLNTCKHDNQSVEQNGQQLQTKHEAPQPFYDFFLGFRPQCLLHPSQYITRHQKYSARYIRFYGDEISGYLKCPHTGSSVNQTLVYNPHQKPWFTQSAQITYTPGFHAMTCIGIYSMLTVVSYAKNGVQIKTKRTLKNLFIMQWQQNETMRKQASFDNQNFPLIKVMDRYWLDEDHRVNDENPWSGPPKTSYIDLMTAYPNMENAAEFIEDMKAGACVATHVEFSEPLGKRVHLILKLREERKKEQAGI